MQSGAAGVGQVADSQVSTEHILLFFQLSMRGRHLKAADGAVRGGSRQCEE